MKSDKKMEQILAALQANKPVLNEAEATDLTNSIMAGIANKKQVSNTNGKLLSIAKVILACAAALLVGILSYQRIAGIDDHQPGIIYNSYYKNTIRPHDNLPQTKSISVLLDYYTQNKKDKSALTILKTQYNHLRRK